MKLADGKGLSDQQLAALHSELVQLTGKLIGEVNIEIGPNTYVHSFSYDLVLWLLLLLLCELVELLSGRCSKYCIV